MEDSIYRLGLCNCNKNCGSDITNHIHAIENKYRKLKEIGLIEFATITYDPDTYCVHVRTPVKDGLSLKEKMKTLVTIEEKISLAEKIIAKIRWLHSLGYVHGWLDNPKSILFDPKGNIILSNFYHSFPIDLKVEFHNEKKSTLPPEMVEEDSGRIFYLPRNYLMDIKYDYWCLGCICILVLTGVHHSLKIGDLPITKQEYNKLYFNPKLPKIPAKLLKIISTLRLKDPAYRTLL